MPRVNILHITYACPVPSKLQEHECARNLTCTFPAMLEGPRLMNFVFPSTMKRPCSPCCKVASSSVQSGASANRETASNGFVVVAMTMIVASSIVMPTPSLSLALSPVQPALAGSRLAGPRPRSPLETSCGSGKRMGGGGGVKPSLGEVKSTYSQTP